MPCLSSSNQGNTGASVDQSWSIVYMSLSCQRSLAEQDSSGLRRTTLRGLPLPPCLQRLQVSWCGGGCAANVAPYLLVAWIPAGEENGAI